MTKQIGQQGDDESHAKICVASSVRSKHSEASASSKATKCTKRSGVSVKTGDKKAAIDVVANALSTCYSRKI